MPLILPIFMSINMNIVLPFSGDLKKFKSIFTVLPHSSNILSEKKQ